MNTTEIKKTLTTLSPFTIGSELTLAWFTTCLPSLIHYSIYWTPSTPSQVTCIAEAAWWT